MKTIHQVLRPLLLGLVFFLSKTALADISGKVFRDFNANGIFDSGSSFNEVGMVGITVKAFAANDAVNAPTATVVSAADGSYTLSNLNSGADYRLEFSWSESWLKAGAADGNGSSVQFVKDGATNVNFAVTNPDEYSQTTNPYLAVPHYINGDPLAASSVGGRTGLYVFPYNAHSPDEQTQTPSPITKASTAQIGATWGTAFQRSTKTLYASAVVRRFAGFGPLGIGGIYKVDMSSPTTTSSGSLSYIDVKSIGIPVGDNPRDGSACNSLATDVNQPSHDIAAAQQVGMIGIGGISMDNEHNRLWLVNLADRKLYGIQNVSPATTPTAADVLGGYSIELPSGMACQSGVLRPWAVKSHQGMVYVGAVCDASSTTPGTDELAGYVLRFDPANTAAGFAVEHTFRLNALHANYGPTVDAAWYGWKDYIADSPILSSIEFDVDGSLMLGILDRGTIMVGTTNYNSLNCADTALSDITGMGDVLRFCRSGSSYVEGGTTGCATTIPDAVKAHDEYYWGDYGPLKDQKIAFNETSQGGLSFLAGSGQLMSNGFDPAGWHEGGIYWFNNQTGADDNRYFIYTTQSGLGHPTETMGKVAGLGDLELILDPAPVEIGNRVWLDSNKNGIQDADEAGLDGVQVTLACGANTANVTTANGGLYLFSNATGGNASFMTSGATCSISIPAGQTVLNGYSITTQNTDGISDNNPYTDIRDSDADSNSAINFTVGNAGENNHGLDVGYIPAQPKTDLKLTKTVDRNNIKRGETVVFTLTLTNESAVATTGVAVTDHLPNGVQLVSATGDGSYDANSGVWTVGDMAGNTTKTLALSVLSQ